MKKLIALILAMLMLLCSTVMAEEAATEEVATEEAAAEEVATEEAAAEEATEEEAVPEEAATEEAAAEPITFKMGIDPEFQPFSYLGDDGEYTGFDVDMAQKVCDILGWELELTPINWDNKLVQLNAGEVDCIWSGLTIDNIPADEYTLSFPYINNLQVIVTKADSGIATLADLAGKIVGVQNGTSAQDMLTDGTRTDIGETLAEISAAETYNVCFADLQGGAVDALAIDNSIATNLINNSDNPDDYVILDEILGPEQYGICFRKDDVDLCAQVEGAFAQLVEDGTYVEIARKYAGQGVFEDALCAQDYIGEGASAQ